MREDAGKLKGWANQYRESEMMSKKEYVDMECGGRDAFNSITAIVALNFLAEKFPHRQFNSAELEILSGLGHTAISQIKNADDSPFSLGKCTMRRLDAWLEQHPGFKQS